MILIDKYELLKEVAKRKYSAASMRLINEQPEVKAIPIEWFINWGNKNCMDAVALMMEDWEKENEIFNKKINKINQ